MLVARISLCDIKSRHYPINRSMLIKYPVHLLVKVRTELKIVESCTWNLHALVNNRVSYRVKEIRRLYHL